MSSFVTPKKNAAFTFYVGLPSQANTLVFQANPTLATGDFKVSIDGGALANLSSLPTVSPASGKLVAIALTSGEMNGDNIQVVASDAAGAEWCDVIVNIQTTTRQVDDLAYPTTSGRSLDVTATGGAGIDWSNVENPTTTLNLSGTSTKAVEPTVASRTLDVSAGGEAGIDWANIGSPTTTVNLSGTTIKTATDIATAIAALNNLSSSDVTTIIAAALTATVADSIPADGSRPSVASGILWLTRFLGERSVSSTTMTVKKEDGSTSSMTFTLNDTQNPTSITRAS